MTSSPQETIAPVSAPEKAPAPNTQQGPRLIRQLIASKGKARRPDFYGIGAEKCGTTWLWQMFRDHPEIGVSLPKELRYFAHRYLKTGFSDFAAIESLLSMPQAQRAKAPHLEQYLDRLATELRIAFGGDAAYLRIFGALKGKIVGDISPQYCMLPPEGIAHMKRLAPEAKIIFLMRDPVERAISAGKMKASAENPELTDARIRAKALIPFQLLMCRYTQVLEGFEAAFPSRIFTGFMDDIITRPLGLMEEICGFLDVGYKADHFKRLNMIANEGAQHSVGPDLKRELYDLLKDEYDLLESRFPERVALWRQKYEAL